jgi:hypothetical protein
MLPLLFVAALAVLAGFYGRAPAPAAAAPQVLQARALAESMAVYRQAVRDYYRAHDAAGAGVDLDTLRAAGTLPAWSMLSAPGAAAPWTHYRAADGVVYVYPAAPVPDLTAELLRLSQRSLTVAVFRAADASLYSPVDGRRTAAPALAALPVPDGAPVWMAGRE